MKWIALPAVVAVVAVVVLALAGCGGSSGDAASADPAEAIVAVVTAYQRAFLDRDAEAACALYTGEAKRELVEDLEYTADCEASLGAALNLLGPEEDAELRQGIRDARPADVEIDGDSATAPFAADSRLRLQRIEGRWYVSDADKIDG